MTMGSSRIAARALNLPAGKVHKFPSSGDGSGWRPPRSVFDLPGHGPGADRGTRVPGLGIIREPWEIRR
ncbi:MAG: hypothetical protein ACLQCU_02890, partial [Acidimicrobiales bacterium]